jgi:hypothetical protein
MTYRLDCTCGHAMYRGADDKAAAVTRFKNDMTQALLDAHWAASHAGEAKPSLADVQGMIEAGVAPAVIGLKSTLPALYRFEDVATA